MVNISIKILGIMRHYNELGFKPVDSARRLPDVERNETISEGTV